MTQDATPGEDHPALRTRAVAQLNGPRPGSSSDARNALGVLHDLASSPATAPQALTLLHELQVHQVELDLQDEELRRIRTELEARLARHVQLYDAAPVAYLTVDPGATLREANRTAERIFGQPRQMLLGRNLQTLLLPQANAVLRDMLARLSGSAVNTAQGTMQITIPGAGPRDFHATASRDPAGRRFLLVLAEAVN